MFSTFKKRIFLIFFNQCFKNLNELKIDVRIFKVQYYALLISFFEKKINDILILFVVTPYSFLMATELFFQYKEICPLGSCKCPSSSLMVS